MALRNMSSCTFMRTVNTRADEWKLNRNPKVGECYTDNRRTKLPLLPQGLVNRQEAIER